MNFVPLKCTTPPSRIILGSVALDPEIAIPRYTPVCTCLLSFNAKVRTSKRDERRELITHVTTSRNGYVAREFKEAVGTSNVYENPVDA
jgi:hypothetical protein